MRLSALAACLLAGASFLHSSEAGAQITSQSNAAIPQDDPSLRPIVSERRRGLVLGVSGGVALAGSSGYPNNARLLNNPDYYSSSPLLVGSSVSYFLMGALTDYLNLGPVVTIATFESSEWKSTGWGLGFRGELFPLLTLVPALADTSVYSQLGVGTTQLRAKGPYPTADGSQSFFGVGVHHEWRLTKLLGGHAAAGPQIEYDIIRAQPVERHWLTLGLRVVWYSGHVALDR
jgi:hypothetical protein